MVGDSKGDKRVLMEISLWKYSSQTTTLRKNVLFFVRIQVQYRNGAKNVLFLESKMFFILKNVIFSGTYRDLCLKKQHF
jgi:hypothetical protein